MQNTESPRGTDKRRHHANKNEKMGPLFCEKWFYADFHRGLRQQASTVLYTILPEPSEAWVLAFAVGM